MKTLLQRQAAKINNFEANLKRFEEAFDKAEEANATEFKFELKDAHGVTIVGPTVELFRQQIQASGYACYLVENSLAQGRVTEISREQLSQSYKTLIIRTTLQ